MINKRAGEDILYNLSDHEVLGDLVWQEYRFFKPGEVHDFTSRLESYVAYAAKYDSPDHILFNRKSYKGLGLSDMQTMRDILNYMPSYQEEVSERVVTWRGEKDGRQITKHQRPWDKRDSLHAEKSKERKVARKCLKTFLKKVLWISVIWNNYISSTKEHCKRHGREGSLPFLKLLHDLAKPIFAPMR